MNYICINFVYMSELENITVSEYIFHPDREQYDAYMYYSKAVKDVFDIGDITELPFGWVKELQYSFTKGITFDALVYLLEQRGVKKESFFGLKFTDYVKFVNWLTKQVEFINNLESDNLSYSVDSKEEQAGIDDFNRFGYMIQIHSLAGNDVTKHKQVEALPYQDCFSVLLYNKTKYEFEKRLNRLHAKV